MRLSLEVKQKQTISQQMIQSVHILQMNTMELHDFLSDLALENPVIDLADPYESTCLNTTDMEECQRTLDWMETNDYQNRVYYQQDSHENLANSWADSRQTEETLADYLLSQLITSDMPAKDYEILRFMIFSLDERGYFVDSLSSVAEHFSVSENLVEDLLFILQSLEPAGVGARSLEECILLQLPTPVDPLLETIVQNHLSDLSKNHIPQVARKLSVSTDMITQCLSQIQKCNPKPGQGFSDHSLMQYIIPDAMIVKSEDFLNIQIREYHRAPFQINTYYASLLQDTTDPEAIGYLRQKIREANTIAEFITQRASTLSQVVQILVTKQADFFIKGPGHKHPLKLSDIAELIQVHESTVSRALKGKYLQCYWGIYPFNYFLTAASPSAQSTTASASDHTVETSEQIQLILQQIIEAEDKKKPLSDQKICDLMQQQYNIPISRRTINKYRGILGIPDKSGRKVW